MKISIIIVSYNTKALTKQCLDSIYNNVKDVDYDVWVVDNKSSDGSAEMIESEFPKVNLIVNRINGGFSQANNLAIKKCEDSEYILLLNPDTIVKPDTIEKSVEFLINNDDVGCLGCKVIKGDGNLDKACKRGFPSPWNSFCYLLKLDKVFKGSKKFGGYNATYIDEDDESEIDCIVGAFMLIRNQVFNKIGLLDESFFMYGEDIDLCYRIKQANWKIYYYPKVEIIHFKGESSKKQSNKMIGCFHKSMFIFYNKHYKNKHNFLVNGFIYFGIYSKWAMSLFKNLFRKNKKVS